ncbi:Retrovirus-related Pol polyprotein from transposon 297 [Mytilus coruscus]|uniref:Retrovirus-related Pol polyprotein from transposon 297 n=1 Tax=Mytilus coruscus TaxID=42192 RepID=A0A6J8A0Q6_MYTCO|nr:Retrovirus-related Pol polyprotein from transposon 297 [Mytilus coruscus]
MAVDAGGPRKEFFRLMLQEIKKKYFDNGFRDLRANVYVSIGKLFALSILQNGKVPQFMDTETLDKIFGDEPLNLEENGCICSLREGLDTLGIVEAVRNLPTLRHIFSNNSPRLTVKKLIQLLKPEFSERGSNRLSLEKNVYSSFMRYIRKFQAQYTKIEKMELPKLEKFNAFETENADIWVQRYELMCEFSKWDEVQATRAFTCFIDNYALAWYMLLDAEDRNSKDKLFRKFKERFGRKSIEKVGLWKDAADLKQKQNETVSQFISRIERLCFLSGQTVMMEQFILRGLRPEFVVPFVTATGLKQNFSVSEAIDAALLADITMQIVSKPEPVEITSAIKDNPTPQNQPRSDVGNFIKIQDDKIFGELKEHFEFIDSIKTGEALNSNNNYIKIATEMGIDLSKSDLSETQKYQLLTLLGQYRQAFAKDITELGCTKIGKHIINTGDANPVRQFPYRTTPKTKEEINTHLDEMEEQGIIRRSMSPWSSPILLVAKPNGEKRVCVDYRKLNRLTKIYTQSLPNLSDVLDTLGEKQAQTYSVCDMRQGFWQLELDEQSKEKTAFMTHRGQYEFNRLPYGLANSPATFNMIMNEVIRDLNWKSALVYVDDILIYSKNFEEHLCHLAPLFDKLIEANLKLKPSKCQFACKEVQYLGHIITKEGIAVDPEKTASVQSFAAPKNVKEVRMFLGLCNYYRKFIHNYSKITSPLNQLLHKDQQFKWTDECQRSLETLKTKLTSAPILVFPDFNKEFILHTDSSGTAIGYVLGQHDKDKKLRVIAFIEWLLSGFALNCTIGFIELSCSSKILTELPVT